MARSEATLQLQVADARLQDVGENRACVSSDVLAAIGGAEGDPIVLTGKSVLSARVAASGPEDEGLGLVRLDGGQRHRLGVALGDMINVCLRELPRAARVRLVLLGSAGDHALSSAHLHESLDGHAVTGGDTVAITPDRRRFEAEVSVLGLSVAGIAGSSTDTDGALARVVATEPAGPVRIDEHTTIEIDHAANADSDREEAAADGT
jgi:hypothetical protein